MSSEHQHRARKRFGQNFLHDHHVIDNILAAAVSYTHLTLPTKA